MSKSITKPKLQDVVVDAAVAAIRRAGEQPNVSSSEALAEAKAVAREVASDPRIAPALVPVSRLQSETLRGIVIAAAAPLVVALGRMAGFEILEGDAATVISTVISLAGAAYAWYGRENTTRPLA